MPSSRGSSPPTDRNQADSLVSGLPGKPTSLRCCLNLRAFSFTFPRHSRLSAELKPCPGLQMVRHQHGVLLCPSLAGEPMSSAPVILLYPPFFPTVIELLLLFLSKTHYLLSLSFKVPHVLNLFAGGDFVI